MESNIKNIMDKNTDNTCPICGKGDIKKTTPNMVCEDGFFICDNCYATKTTISNEWVKPTRKVLGLDSNTNHPIFSLYF